MYENTRKEICKKINSMSDNDLILFFAHLAVIDVEILDRIVNFAILKDKVDALEEDLEKGVENE